MSTAALEGLRDYLYSTLSPSNMLWLGTQLTDYAKQTQTLRRYTKEELNAMLDEAEREFEAGEYLTDDEVWSKYGEELKEEEELQLEAV